MQKYFLEYYSNKILYVIFAYCKVATSTKVSYCVKLRVKFNSFVCQNLWGIHEPGHLLIRWSSASFISIHMSELAWVGYLLGSNSYFDRINSLGKNMEENQAYSQYIIRRCLHLVLCGPTLITQRSVLCNQSYSFFCTKDSETFKHLLFPLNID